MHCLAACVLVARAERARHVANVAGMCWLLLCLFIGLRALACLLAGWLAGWLRVRHSLISAPNRSGEMKQLMDGLVHWVGHTSQVRDTAANPPFPRLASTRCATQCGALHLHVCACPTPGKEFEQRVGMEC